MATNTSKTTQLAESGCMQTEKNTFSFGAAGSRKNAPLTEEFFHSALVLERRRAERSRKPFVLMLLDTHLTNGGSGKLLKEVSEVLASSTRETDLLGWYKNAAVLGVIFTELGSEEPSTVCQILQKKAEAVLRSNLGVEAARRLAMSFHFFPEDPDPENAGPGADFKLYPDLSQQKSRKKVSLALKRSMDVAGSAMLLLLLSPVLAFIALAIKFTSKGPVLFEQQRLMQFGKRFRCLKFRTMFVNCNSKIHQEYVQQFISGKMVETVTDRSAPTVFKITNDPRVTPIGRILRKTSLDELPQLWNVLRGEMSLVGPRPPVPYEFEIYQLWHRRRVLEVKPGITGLWQVSGRSRTQFDDMVRLDLRYLQTWSVWLDLKILLATPWAVFSGDGAY